MITVQRSNLCFNVVDNWAQRFARFFSSFFDFRYLLVQPELRRWATCSEVRDRARR